LSYASSHFAFFSLLFRYDLMILVASLWHNSCTSVPPT
jgi:hypothetical protein